MSIVVNSGKKRYKSIVFKTIRESGGITRGDLGLKLGINKNTVSSITEELVSEELIMEENTIQNKKAGRNPVNLIINPNKFYALGISISAEKITLVVTDFCSNAIFVKEEEIAYPSLSSIKASIVKIIKDTLVSFDEKKIIGIGIGVPGILEENGEVVKYSSHLKWDNVHLKKLLENDLNLDIPIKMNNNVKIAALGEIHQFPDKKKETVVYCNIGHGVGGSFVVNGQTFGGANNSAGELGHITVEQNGSLCHCGNRGCLETLISVPALTNLTLEKIRSTPESPLNELLKNSLQPINLEDVVDFANQGEMVATEVIHQAGTYLGGALSYIVNLLNPHRIIISGTIVRAEEMLFKSVRAELQKKSLYTSLVGLKIEKGSLGSNAIPIGAATSVILDWLP